MNGCEGCFQSAKGMQETYSVIRAKAIKWSNDNQKSVALYQEGYEVLYMDAETAVKCGKVVKEIITYKG